MLITGGTGFLGRALIKRLLAQSADNEITVVSRDETKQDMCKQKYPNVRYVLGDVTDYERMEVLCLHKDLVIHTAALKYVPEAEFNVDEALKINVYGSQVVASCCARAGVHTVVGISTDKASSPVSVYGMTKALMERLWGNFAVDFPGTKFTLARYGNVVGSTGSVIPLFEQQFAQRGVVQVTDPRMTRFWLSINDAVDLVLGPGLEINSGSIAIPNPKGMSIGELAELIAGDQVQVIGARPGERKHELLINNEESVRVESINTCYELHKVGTRAVHDPFILASNYADPLSRSEMQQYMEDAKGV